MKSRLGFNHLLLYSLFDSYLFLPCFLYDVQVNILVSYDNRILGSTYLKFPCYLYILLVPSISDFNNLTILFVNQWMPELRRFAPNVPVILVGTKLGV